MLNVFLLFLEPWVCSTRLRMIILTCIGSTLMYAQRISFSLALVCMVNQTALDMAVDNHAIVHNVTNFTRPYLEHKYEVSYNLLNRSSTDTPLNHTTEQNQAISACEAGDTLRAISTRRQVSINTY